MKFQSLNESILSVTNPQPEFTQEEYIELLESALESIAEELECDVEDLLEDVQTPQRTRQLRSMIDKAEKGKRPGGIATAEYSDKQYNSTKSGAKKLLGYRKAEKDEKSGIKLFNKEAGSKKLYGRGGKVIKKATVKEEQTAQLSPAQRAAAMKDRNSGIHRTPAELKAHTAGMKAYVKSQNNRTDSKGKKLDPYDDYQS
jgi:hypothetical protein